MLEKLDTTIEKLLREKRIKTKWSQIEIHGITEIINLLWQDEIEYGTIGQIYTVKNKTIYQNLFEGIPYRTEDKIIYLVRAYIDVDDNIIFMSSKDELYLYETDNVDAEDLKHFSMGE